MPVLFRAYDRLALNESFVFSATKSPKSIPLALLPYGNSRNSQYQAQHVFLVRPYTDLGQLLL